MKEERGGADEDRQFLETKQGEEKCLAEGAETFREDEGIKSESDRWRVVEREG